jgi:hypothetical protein
VIEGALAGPRVLDFSTSLLVPAASSFRVNRASAIAPRLGRHNSELLGDNILETKKTGE